MVFPIENKTRIIFIGGPDIFCTFINVENKYLLGMMLKYNKLSGKYISPDYNKLMHFFSNVDIRDHVNIEMRKKDIDLMLEQTDIVFQYDICFHSFSE
jgi:hypothetical protein